MNEQTVPSAVHALAAAIELHAAATGRLAAAIELHAAPAPNATTALRAKGVKWDAERGNWRAVTHHGGKAKVVGRYATEAAAAAAYLEARQAHKARVKMEDDEEVRRLVQAAIQERMGADLPGQVQ